MKTAAALNSEKITMALNNADKAGNSAKTLMKKMSVVTTLQKDVSALKTSQVRGLLKCKSINRYFRTVTKKQTPTRSKRYKVS